MNGRITAEELYRTRREEIERMAQDIDSPLLREYARKFIALANGGPHDSDSRKLYD